MILITYATTEDAVRRALAAVGRDRVISGKPQVIRIEKNSGDYTDRHVSGLYRDGARAMSSTITVQPDQVLERILTIEIVRVTERAAVSAARLRGRGDEKAADQAAVDAMRRELNKLPIDGTVVIGEGELRRGADAVHRREGRQQARPEGRYRGRSARRHDACAPRTCRARSPPWPWPKAARCCMRPTSTWKRSRSAPAIRRAWSISMRRPRRTSAISPRPRASSRRDHRADPRPAAPRRPDRRRAQGRRVGGLITDGDVAGVIHTADPDKTGIDIYLGIGGAPEGVLAAAALRCIGGQMQCRLVLDTEEKRERAAKMGIKDPRKRYEIEDMVQRRLPVRGDRRHRRRACCAASSSASDMIETETVVMRSVTGTVRWIRAEHRQLEKFHLD